LAIKFPQHDLRRFVLDHARHVDRPAVHFKQARGKFRIPQVRRPHDEPIAGGQALVDLAAPRSLSASMESSCEWLAWGTKQ
jgi:hypothetical protein